MFNPEQRKHLEAKLNTENVSQRNKAGTQISYVEGWFVMAEANRIFGHEGWDRETCLSRLGEPELVDGKWRARFMAQVTIKVRAGDTIVTRSGVGFGSGIAKDAGDAYEGAIKEAETDATKRALATFGWPFGLALYDKERQHVQDGPDWSEEHNDISRIVMGCDTLDELRELWSGERIKAFKSGAPRDKLNALVKLKDERKTALEQVREAA